jgi:4-hydroxybenzoate polyprenyltransferase
VDEQTSMAWAMVLIGSAAVVSGIVGYRMPRGERSSVALPLLIGAGVGIVALFLQALGGAFDEPERASNTFLISSILGFIAVMAGLAVLVRGTRDRGES